MNQQFQDHFSGVANRYADFRPHYPAALFDYFATLAPVGLITVAQALHWFELERFYVEARRVLDPGGVLATWAYGINEVEGDSVNQLVQDFYANIVGPYWPPERKLVEEGYRTIPFPFAEITPPTFGMEARWALEQLLGYFSTWSATNRFIKATGRNPLEPLSEALARVWAIQTYHDSSSGRCLYASAGYETNPMNRAK